MLNFVICDDNINLLNKLKHMLEDIFLKHGFEAQVSFSSDNSYEILDYIKNNSVDVLLLDINLKSKTNGLDLAKEFRRFKKHSYLIFTTGHLEYAMLAYKYKTFDYLAKPIVLDRLESTILRLFDDVNSLNKRYLKIDNKNTLVAEDDIQYIKRDGMKLIFNTSSHDYDTYSSFAKFQDKLPKSYVRCHKSYIANINQIKDVEPVSGVITFYSGATCDIGPKYKKEFMEVLKNYECFE